MPVASLDSFLGLLQKYAATQVSVTITSCPPLIAMPTSVNPKIALEESSVAPMVAVTDRHVAATCEPSSVRPLMPTFSLHDPWPDGGLHGLAPTSSTARAGGKVADARSVPSTMRRFPAYCGTTTGADTR